MAIIRPIFPGMKIIVNSRATPNGFPVPLGQGVILSALGDVPNLYKVKITGDYGGYKGEIGLELKAFVYEEDIID